MDVQKTLLEGPDGATDVDDEFGTIGIRLPDAQSFLFEIKITNEGSPTAAIGAVVFDVVPAEYNLDPDAEDLVTGPGADDGNCDDAATGGFVEPCDGAWSDNNVACMVSTSTSGGGGKKGGVGLEPEFVTIEIGDLDADDDDGMCAIKVAVVTEENPASVKKSSDPAKFEPTGCHAFLDKNGEVIVDSNGKPIVDWIALNDGVKVYDPEDGSLFSGPGGSIQLRPVGCDTDGDGFTDQEEIDAGTDPLDDTDFPT